ncbi:MAG: aspartyl protease family protein [Polaribacter sp.]
MHAQSGFNFLNASKKKQSIKFQRVNNLIVIPLEINGKKLSFILDTGVNKTILFNLSKNDSLELLNTQKISIKGLGKGRPVNAIISKKNKIQLKGLINKNETIYVVLKDFFDLSGRMGRTIHGIIGYSVFKNFIIKINYQTKKLIFYNPKFYTYKKCKRCFTTPLKFFQNKPFLKAKTVLDTINGAITDVNMLIDTGGSDALWLFEQSKKEIQTPINHFNDILGEGLSGTIYGNRSRIPKFMLGDFEIKNPTVSFLDSVSSSTARKYKDRNGSIGGGILSRFLIWVDYPNRKITFKKNGSFTKQFNYNMSGLDVAYSGKELVKQKKTQSFEKPYGETVSAGNSISLVTSYEYKLRPSYKIKRVVKNSVADRAGLKENDKIISLNGRSIQNFTLADIIYRFQEKNGKKIRMTILRNNVKMKFVFRLYKKI